MSPPIHSTVRPRPRRLLPRVVAAAAAVAALAAAPLGAQTTYAGQTPADAAAARAAFNAALGTVVTAPLTGLSGTSIPLGALGSATITNGQLASGSIFAPSASQGTPLTLTFSQTLTGFGATFSDIGSCCGNLPFPAATVQLSFFNGGTGVGVFNRQFAMSGELRGDPAFFGVTGLVAFDRVEIRANTGDFYNVFDPAVGIAAVSQPPVSTVPEPGSLALLGTGLAGLTAAARRRRHA